MNQLTYQSAVQDTIQALSEFGDADVVINDYSILDGPVDEYVIIENLQTGRITEGMGGVEAGTFELPFAIYVPFVDWKTSLDTLRNREDAVINGFNGDDWSASGTPNVAIMFVRLENRIELYDPASEQTISDPVYLVRPVVLEMEFLG